MPLCLHLHGRAQKIWAGSNRGQPFGSTGSRCALCRAISRQLLERALYRPNVVIWRPCSKRSCWTRHCTNSTMSSTIASIGCGFRSRAPCDCSRSIVHIREILGETVEGGGVRCKGVGGALSLVSTPYNLALAFGKHLMCEHLDQSRGPGRGGDLPGENLLRGHATTVILGIRVIACANDCPFKRDTGKHTLAPAVGVDCGYGHDPNL